MALIHAQRFDANGHLPDPKGNIFRNGKDERDLSHIKILMSSVDTVRQLYESKIKPSILSEIEPLISTSRSRTHIFTISGNQFILAGGGASQYQYRLQNNELGLIVFIKSSNIKAENHGSHIKIECSPTILLRRSPRYIQDLMDSIASELSEGEIRHRGVAIHLALDIQGWSPDRNFSNDLFCRSPSRVQRDGISNAEFSVNEISVNYGDCQSLTFGTPTSIQMCGYNKTKQMKKVDKTEFFVAAWNGEFPIFKTTGSYDEKLPVQRLEHRFSHKILSQFHEGLHNDSIPCDSGLPSLKNYADASYYLDRLWQYAMLQFKYLRTKQRFHLEWDKFIEDACFTCNENSINDDFKMKRVIKKQGVDNSKNVAAALGHIISISARNRCGANAVLRLLRNSCIWNDVLRYFRDKGFRKGDMKEWFADALIKRRMLGMAA